MAKINDIHSIIVSADAPIFSAHTYTEILGGTAGCTVTLNDTVVEIAPSSSISIWVRTISGGAGCYLLGDNKDVTQGSPNVG